MDLKKILIIAGVGVAAIFLAVNFWLTRPVYKFERAIGKNDLKTAAQYYDRLTPEEAENNGKKLYFCLNDIVNKYTAGEISYDDALGEISVFEDSIYKNSSDYKAIKKLLNNQKESFEAWDRASEAYEKGDYYNAIKDYENVIVTDTNYLNAKDKIDECKQKVADEIIGTWTCDIEIGRGALKENGIEKYGEDVIIPITMTMEIMEDNKALISLGSDTFAEDFQKYMDNLVDVSVEMIADLNDVSVKTVSDKFENFLGMSLNEYIYKVLKCDKIENAIEDSKLDYTYELDGKNLILNYNNEKSVCEIDGDKMIYNDFPAHLQYRLEQLQVEFPLVFTKQN